MKKVHYSGYGGPTPTEGNACACRPDGEHGTVRLVTSDTSKVTCRSCLRLLG